MRSSVTLDFLDTGTMVALLKHVGTADWDRDGLVCACSEIAVRDAVWAGNLARVNTFKMFYSRWLR